MRDSITSARIGELQLGVLPSGVASFGGVEPAPLTAVQEFCFRADDPTFTGHFPTRPILPGIFQIEMARVMAQEVVNHSLSVREITKAKFLWPIVPEEKIRVELKLVQKEETIQARANFFAGGNPRVKRFCSWRKHEVTDEHENTRMKSLFFQRHPGPIVGLVLPTFSSHSCSSVVIRGFLF